MNSKWFVVLVLIVCAAGILAFAACSLIGLGIGAAVDSTKPKIKKVSGWELVTVERGTRMEVVMKDGQRRVGEYGGMDRVPQKEYSQSVAGVPGANLPAVGSRITVFTLAAQHEGAFVGFDDRSWSGNPVLQLLEESAFEPMDIPLDVISAISDSDSNNIDGEAIRQLATAGAIPTLSALVLQKERLRTLIPLDKVDQIQVQVARHGKLIGFLVGATIDVVVIAIAVSSSDESDSGASSDSSCVPTSCPFVYSFDGDEYRRDSETFGGAIFKSAQRTDWDNLDHLREVDGAYRMKLTNELWETQFVDEFVLIVVDHPRGTKVVPSFSGRLHTLSAPQAPTKAIAQDGSDVLDLIEAKDERVWASNPFGRNPENKSHGRDAVELEFQRPQNAGTAKLLFNVQNTLWASYMQGQMLTLHGRELDRWYSHMDSSVVARNSFKKAMIREGMLRVKLWNGEHWRDAAFVWEVGPSVPKDEIVEVDLHDIPGETLRVKVESTVGFWIINCVQADYTADVPIQIIALCPDKAVDHLGSDLRDVLRYNDGRHYVMPTTKDWAEFSFAAPRRSKDMARSFILKSTGYYTIHVAGEGEPQMELLARLMTEPGAYGQYTLRLLDEEMAAVWEGDRRR